MLNKQANELVCLVAGQLEWLWATEVGEMYYKDALHQFSIATARLAVHRGSSGKWKNAFYSLTELSGDLAERLEKREEAS